MRLFKISISIPALLVPFSASASDFGGIGAALVLGPLALVALVVAIVLTVLSRSERIGGFVYVATSLIALPLTLLSIGMAFSAWSNDLDKPLVAWSCMLLCGFLTFSLVRFNLRYWGQHFTR